MKERTRIRKSTIISNDGYIPNVLYCFNYNLKGTLCGQCESNKECLEEYYKLNQIFQELKEFTNKYENQIDEFYHLGEFKERI